MGKYMLDGVSLDQLRTFIAAVDEGSFSAAARKLNRVQSAVSGWVGSLEAHHVLARTDYKEVPPRVDYALTPLGRSLADALVPLCSWGAENMAEVASIVAGPDKPTVPLAAA
jgi:DNA-binding HxlR family transcriptional regulator